MPKITTILLAGSLVALPMAARAQAGVPPGKQDKHEDASGMHGKREKHPAIRKAIKALGRAKSDLEHASHDFGGHRADALKAVDEAIKQLQLALDYDKK